MAEAAAQMEERAGMDDRQDLPEFCDFLCPHAGFPEPDATGACRTVAAVVCKVIDELVPKNAPCLVRRRRDRRKTAERKG
jgi:hypothetical protein